VWETFGYDDEDAALASVRGRDTADFASDLKPEGCYPWDGRLYIPSRGALDTNFNLASRLELDAIAGLVKTSGALDFARFRRYAARMIIASFRSACQQRTHVFWAFVIIDLVSRLLNKDTVARALGADDDFAGMHLTLRGTWLGLLRNDMTADSTRENVRLRRIVASSELAKRVHQPRDRAEVIAWCISIGAALSVVLWDTSVTDVDQSCVICKDRVADTMMTPCEHIVCCSQCVGRYIEREGREQLLCPLCRTPANKVVACATMRGKSRAS
jgi:hypothetical protein